MAKHILTKEEANQIAATCYLAIWQIEEFGTDLCEGLTPQPFKDILKIMDYPTEPIYDNDSCPLITWLKEPRNTDRYRDRIKVLQVDLISLAIDLGESSDEVLLLINEILQRTNEWTINQNSVALMPDSSGN